MSHNTETHRHSREEPSRLTRYRKLGQGASRVDAVEKCLCLGNVSGWTRQCSRIRHLGSDTIGRKTATLACNWRSYGVNFTMKWLRRRAFLYAALCWVGTVAARVSLFVLDPLGEITAPALMGILPRVSGLDGKRNALVENSKAGSRHAAGFWREASQTPGAL